jgi:hypothetical protein
MGGVRYEPVQLVHQVRRKPDSDLRGGHIYTWMNTPIRACVPVCETSIRPSSLVSDRPGRHLMRVLAAHSVRRGEGQGNRYGVLGLHNDDPGVGHAVGPGQ